MTYAALLTVNFLMWPHLERLLQAINDGRSGSFMERINPDDPSFQVMVSGKFMDALLALHDHPLAFDLSRYPNVL